MSNGRKFAKGVTLSRVAVEARTNGCTCSNPIVSYHGKGRQPTVNHWPGCEFEMVPVVATAPTTTARKRWPSVRRGGA